MLFRPQQSSISCLAMSDFTELLRNIFLSVNFVGICSVCPRCADTPPLCLSKYYGNKYTKCISKGSLEYQNIYKYKDTNIVLKLMTGEGS